MEIATDAGWTDGTALPRNEFQWLQTENIRSNEREISPDSRTLEQCGTEEH